MPNDDVLIVGAGLAGLSCALALRGKGVGVTLLEAGDAPGGRVRTDTLDGFLLDRGFQIFLTAYPAAQRLLDYDALNLRPFVPGAVIRFDGAFRRLADPWRRPLDGVLSAIEAMSKLGEYTDALRIARLRQRALDGPLEALFQRPEVSTAESLAELGLSPGIIARFLRPYFAGIYLDPELRTSSRMLDFVFRMMAAGEATLPAGGMGAIPAQLASRVGRDRIRLRTRVAGVGPEGVTLADGESLSAGAVVLAAHEPETRRLLAARAAALGKTQETLAPPRTWNAVTCLYFDAPAPLPPPLHEPILFLNGDRFGKPDAGPINNLVVPSAVAPSYAPPGRALISVSVLGDPPMHDAALQGIVRRELTQWFGPIVEMWRLLRIYRVRHALPLQPPGSLEPAERPNETEPGLYVCGDHLDNASIQGAMASGLRAAEAVLRRMGK
ncbi:MAG: NAD(P)/FAD-dependent oxidoreductase [Planctomycetota bacterium]|nr:NAD(P)/FAD-dependent oxidoreductase [Planctomycetota bacterium]